MSIIVKVKILYEWVVSVISTPYSNQVVQGFFLFIDNVQIIEFDRLGLIVIRAK